MANDMKWAEELLPSQFSVIHYRQHYEKSARTHLIIMKMQTDNKTYKPQALITAYNLFT